LGCEVPHDNSNIEAGICQPLCAELALNYWNIFLCRFEKTWFSDQGGESKVRNYSCCIRKFGNALLSIQLVGFSFRNLGVAEKNSFGVGCL
jgi:hypothetical protein